jgi:signal transduction histidine kinase
MNYFNYFTEIEDTFIRRRGKHLLLSPMDWALIESWKEMGVPLHVALRGIERSFDSFESKPRRRTVKSLLYCQEEVEAQFAEWQEAQVGANGNGVRGAASEASEAALPFSRAAIVEHLERARQSLQKVCNERKRSRKDDFCDALQRAADRLGELKEDFSRAARADAEKLEESLTSLEKMLDAALEANLPARGLVKARAEAEEQLQPYRGRMEQAVYEQTLNNLFLKRLREAHGLPRLSLFYL